MRIAMVVALAAFAGGAAAQMREPCMETYNAEVVAIERDAKARQNVGTDAAKQRAASDAQARLKAAAKRAKECQDAARAPADPAKAAAKATATAADDCKDKTSAHAAEIERRFGSEHARCGAAGRAARRGNPAPGRAQRVPPALALILLEIAFALARPKP